MKRFFKLYRIFTAQYLKRLMEYKIDFLTGFFSFLLMQAIDILFITIIFSQIPSLEGWSYEQIIFIYGFSLIPLGLDHLFTDNLWNVANSIVRMGEFDKYLTRPFNPLLQVIMEQFQIDALGELVTGIVLICIVAGKVGLVYNIKNVLLFIVAAAFGALIYTDIKIFSAALAFWLKRSSQVLYMLYQVKEFAKYPTTIYNKFVRNIITYVIPFAFTAFYPASYFLTGKNPLFCIGGTVGISLVMFAFSYWVWKRGLNAYESAGS